MLEMRLTVRKWLTVVENASKTPEKYPIMRIKGSKTRKKSVNTLSGVKTRSKALEWSIEAENAYKRLKMRAERRKWLTMGKNDSKTRCREVQDS